MLASGAGNPGCGISHIAVYDAPILPPLAALAERAVLSHRLCLTRRDGRGLRLKASYRLTVITMALAAGCWAMTWAIPYAWLAGIGMGIVGAYTGLWLAREADKLC